MQYKKTKQGMSILTAMMVTFFSSQLFAADLNICAGKNEMPFSNDSQEGFENDIAKLLGKQMNRKVNFVWWTNGLIVGKNLDENKCDVVIGADANDPRILATKPYYKSAYVFITRKDREIDIDSWDHPYLKERNFRIGVMPDSPGKNMLLQINRFDDMFDYFTEIQNFQSTRNRYIRVEPSRLVNDVETMYLHAAMLWAPEAARYVNAKSDLKMVVVQDTAKKSNGEKIPMHYEVVMGVRKGNTALQEEINKAIDATSPEIQAVLKKEGIPLLPLN
jgi:mxaJ protein